MTYSIDRKKKKELWEENKTPLERFKINARVMWRRFDTQTRGMGLFFVLILAVVISSAIFPLAGQSIQRSIDNERYKTALITACINMDFYSWNYKQCEDIGVRP